MSLRTRVAGSYKIRAARAKVQAVGALALSAATPIIAICRRARLPGELAQRPDLHIHFGCGGIDHPRFLNVDARPLPHVHLVTRSPLLREFGNGVANSLYACHVFEHFPYAQQSMVLRRWHEILKPGGRLMISVPDLDKMLARYIANGRTIEAIQGTLMGGQDYPSNFHFALFNEAHLCAKLEHADFTDICHWHPSEEQDWPKDYSWDDAVSLNLSARKR